jgi:phospholipid transport system transporter-binding protein
MRARDLEHAEVVGEAGGRVVVRGALTFDTAAALERSARNLIAAAARGEGLDVDLQGVTRADSAGLALLVGWLAQAREAGTTVRYSAIPERLLAIARISEVDGLLTGVAAPG